MDGIRERSPLMSDVLSARLMNPAAAGAPDRLAASWPQKPGKGRGEDAAALREAAKEFEALFLSYMLNVMRESIEDSGLTDSGLGRDIYTELFDQELARSLAGRGALGIADLLMRKLSDPTPADIPDSRTPDLPAATSPPAPEAAPRDDEEVPDFRMPVHAHLSSGFGIRKDPFTDETRFHRGIDLAAPAGMEVRAACAGRVVFSGSAKGYGNTVVLQHPGGFETRYAHLGTLAVKAGDTLQPRQVLGTVGNTGRSTGPHLHFEVSRQGVRVDPAALLAD
jgi:murein DD-endopeptidase MepM/ murein hydrolase activator NlpD